MWCDAPRLMASYSPEALRALSDYNKAHQRAMNRWDVDLYFSSSWLSSTGGGYTRLSNKWIGQNANFQR